MGLGPFSFLEDNDPRHTSRIVQNWYLQKHVVLDKIPPSSPDLNVAENAIGELKRRVYRNKNQYTSLSALESAVRREWATLKNEKQYFKRLFDSYPVRLEKIKLNKGYNTKF